MTDLHNSCARSPELIHLQCLECGSVTTGNLTTIAECPRCGALDYHIFRCYISFEEAAHYRRAAAPDNKDVVQRMIELVQSKSR